MSEKTVKKESENNKRDIWYGIGLAVFVLILWVVSWALIDTYIVSDNTNNTNLDSRGLFGDKFGAVNSLFSGLAFAGIIFTIFLQKRELALQREELQETRNEFIQQNDTLKKQRFENTFFQLLSLHNEIVDKLRMRAAVDQTVYEKREFFIGAIKELKYGSTYPYFKYSALNKLQFSEISAFKAQRTTTHGFFVRLENDELKSLHTLTDKEIENFISEPVQVKEDNIKKDYQDFFHKYQHNLGHYFRNLYHIYKYVHTTKLIPHKEKQFYCNIVRAQLSTDELVLIFYNALTPMNYYSDEPNLGHPNFKYLIDTYDILQNMNSRLLLDFRHEEIFEKNVVNEEPETFRRIKDEL